MKCEPFTYRSSWELQYALWLDAQNDVVSYRYEPYSIPYVSNKRSGRERKYWPDFEVTMSDGSRVLVEIKPKRKVSQTINVKKFMAATLACVTLGITFKVITEVDLKGLGLLK